ncbi:MAG: choice-of-anchor C family protein [Gemmataceae bacterium]|nr:choice-of-anchor C family protein [Gemmata sp.]MDW8196623.1 choice-of-anchor C family protein [Gemmataceae bacterium]
MRLFVAVILSIVWAGSASASIIINGSFEQGTNLPPTNGFVTLSSGSTAITGWTVGGAGIDWIDNGYWNASQGLRSLDLSAVNAGSISQTFSTIPGQAYLVQFDMAGNTDGGPAIKTLTADVGAGPITFSFDTTGRSRPGNMGWETKSFVFTATSSTTTLTFTSTVTTAFGPALDNVSVTPIPEPMSLMVLGGLMVSGLAAVRRRKAATV